MQYRIDLCYIGTDFHGWQSQPDGKGIQDCLEKALSTILRHPVRVNGASRTDTGVHAEHQVATFRSDAPFEPYLWIGSLHGLLPKTIGIKSIVAVPEDFHAINSCKAKLYRYSIWNSPFRDPFKIPYTWHVGQRLDLEIIKRQAEQFIGEHDFTSFCAARSSVKTKKRTILELNLKNEAFPLLEIEVLGTGFLKQMVRTMAGTLVNFGSGLFAETSVKEMILFKDRKKAGETAPAQGLCLVKIFY